ncbi:MULTISPECIES: hypothetical protein [Paenibacillus]|uniref:NIPSNAP domain-containing protein n=1 Tax=Paenibacillus whitsoniae TaxID=2496558 RepID=A0A3S0A3S0_9BACL|nr:hypothetical protein [Paenibacillus whitsoniae]RTE08856.1 hypothetical protein EJQ19_15150 [Paenibacillus whitsoniae]
MSKVFVEYAINADFMETYLIYMREWQAREGRLQVMEGTDQQGLFVEIWDGVTFEEYGRMKEERLRAAESGKGEAAWEQWVRGGLAKLHMWHFTGI